MNSQGHDAENQLKSMHEPSERIGSAEIPMENLSYPKGIRFWLITFAWAGRSDLRDNNEANLVRISIALFLTNLEIPIVTTSIVTITDDLGGFDKASWIISSYLLGYVGMYPDISPSKYWSAPGVVVIFAKLSDVLGRKPLLATAIIIFVISSAACGAAQTIVQL